MRDSILTLSFKYFVLITLSVLMFLPIFVAISGSIRTTGDFLNNPFGFPSDGIYWDNYINILSGENFWRSLQNTLFITVSVTVLNIFLSCCLAFVFTRVKFPTRGFWFNVLSIGLLFPIVVAILPIFIQARNLGLLGSLWGVVLPMVAFGLPGSVVILRGFFIAIPDELEDAAYIDGATTLDFLFRILIPMARPAIIAVATLQIIGGWNEYFLPLVILSSQPERWPLSMGLQQFQRQFGADWAGIMAYITILMMPTIVFYLFTQKYIVTGLTGGELKG